MEAGDANPVLMQVMAAWDDAGYFAMALDDKWRIVSTTSELTASLGTDARLVGEFVFGPAQVEAQLKGQAGANAAEEIRRNFRSVAPWILADFGRDFLRHEVHPLFRDLVDELEPSDDAAVSFGQPTTSYGSSVGSTSIYERIRDETGRVVGAITIVKPAVGMGTLFLLAAPGDLGHFERMQYLATSGRRPAAVLFADLEGSAPLAKRLPTEVYFRLVRRLTRTADECIVDAGGLVGRHAGDGVTAFFVAETSGSESAAARGCIEAIRRLHDAARDIAEHHDLPPDEFRIRAGLHWGTTLYVGSIITRGRTEVTALGDEVNEAARIEACAVGGRALASKSLLERLDGDDAAALGIDLRSVTYTQLGDLGTASEKARRDAPSIAVTDIAVH